MTNIMDAIITSSAPKKGDEKVERIFEIPDENLSNTLFP
jgi:hypothetical protein